MKPQEPDLWGLCVSIVLFTLHFLHTCLAEISPAFQLSALSERELAICFITSFRALLSLFAFKHFAGISVPLGSTVRSVRFVSSCYVYLLRFLNIYTTVNEVDAVVTIHRFCSF